MLEMQLQRHDGFVEKSQSVDSAGAQMVAATQHIQNNKGAHHQRGILDSSKNASVVYATFCSNNTHDQCRYQ